MLSLSLRFLVASTSVALMLLQMPAHAQGTASIAGLVRDPRGTALPGARVTLANAGTGVVRGAITDSSGAFRFPFVSTAGSYTVAAHGAGFRKAEAAAIVLRADETRFVELRLQEYASDDVTVVADRVPLINRVNAEVSSSLSQRDVETIPTDGREINNQLYFLPGVTPATGYFPEAPKLSLSGQNSLYANYLIDGFDNNEQFLGGQKFNTPVDIAQNVAVLANNYSVEFGRTANGVINLTTKSGDNDLHGELFYATHPGPSIDAKDAFAPRDPITGQVTEKGFIRNQVGGSLSGPLVRDRTFFFVNAQLTRDNVDNTLKSPVVDGISTDHTSSAAFTAKIDQHWSSEHTTSLRANVGIVGYEYAGGGTVMPSAGFVEDRNAFLVAAKHTWNIGAVSLDETRVQYSGFHWNYRSVGEGSPQVTVISADSAAGLANVRYGGSQLLGTVGNAGFLFDATEKTWQAGNTFTTMQDHHTLKFGVDVIASSHSLIGGTNHSGNYTVQLKNDNDLVLPSNTAFDLRSIPSADKLNVLSYSVEAQQSPFGVTQVLLAAFAEDSYKPTERLTLNAGLRWDFDNLTKAGSSGYDWNNVAPRLSANYRLGSDGRSVIRGGYGVFYEKIIYSVASDAMQFSTRNPAFLQQLQTLKDKGLLPASTDLNAITSDGNATATFTSGVQYGQGKSSQEVAANLDLAPPAEMRIKNPNGLQNPYSHQLSLGYARQIADDLSVSVDGVLLFGENLVRLVDVNAPSPYATLSAAAANAPRSIASADSTRPAGAVVGGARQITMSETGGKSRYQAVMLNVRKAFADSYTLNVAYTLSWNRNNTDDINFRAQDANDFGSEYAYAVNDRRHVIAVTASHDVLTNTTVSLNALIQSGAPINRTVGPTNDPGVGNYYGHGSQFGDGYAGNLDRYPGVPRDGERLPWSAQFDLAVNQRVRIGGTFANLRADIFNLFNSVNYSGYVVNATQSNRAQFGRPGDPVVYRSAGPPRQFQFTVSFGL